jgi:hypothetical protein
MVGVCLLATSLTSVAAAQQSSATPAPSRPDRKAFTITPASSPIVVDGDLNEPAWASATVIPLIYEWQPGDNVPASVETLCLVTFDAE